MVAAMTVKLIAITTIALHLTIFGKNNQVLLSIHYYITISLLC